jgi:23S rRNA (guanosine2251-2'-O)-methyltransferase
MRKLTNAENIKRQQINTLQARIPVTVVLNNIRSLYNVGSIFRTADGVGIEKLWLCGITGAPPQNQIAKTALGAEQNVAWEHRRDTAAVVRQLKADGYQIVLLEQTDASIPHDNFVPKFPVCLVVGNEIEGINDELLGLCDQAVEIDMAGVKNSLNVSVAFGVMAYYFRSRYKKVR